MVETSQNFCRVCASGTKNVLLVRSWPLNACSACGFVQVDRKPSQKELDHIYSETYLDPKKYEESTQDLLFEAEVFYANNENLQENVAEMFLNLEEENINDLFDPFDLKPFDELETQKPSIHRKYVTRPWAYWWSLKCRA